MRQDRPLEVLQGRPGLDSELVHQRRSRVPVALKRVGLTPGAVEREHQLPLQALAQRMLVNKRLELADQRLAIAQRKVRVDPILKRRQALLLEPRDLALRERLIGEIGQRRPRHSARASRKPLPPSSRIASLQHAATLSDQRLEALQVDLAALGRST